MWCNLEENMHDMQSLKKMLQEIPFSLPLKVILALILLPFLLSFYYVLMPSFSHLASTPCLIHHLAEY